jgi:hypothetical protein
MNNELEGIERKRLWVVWLPPGISVDDMMSTETSVRVTSFLARFEPSVK